MIIGAPDMKQVPLLLARLSKPSPFQHQEINSMKEQLLSLCYSENCLSPKMQDRVGHCVPKGPQA